VGAILINTIEASFSESEIFQEAWRLIIGIVFVLVVLFLPRGLAGLARDALGRIAAVAQRTRAKDGESTRSAAE
jgi:urea transport system permease protein